MWTKRNDRAPKVNVLVFKYICPKRAVVTKKKSSLTILLSSPSLPQKTFHLKFIISPFLCHWALFFSTEAPLLPLPPLIEPC